MSEDEGFEMYPEKLSGLYQDIITGDVPGIIQSADEVTKIDLSPNQMTLVIWVGLIYAIAALTRRWQPLLQPIFEAIGERMRSKSKDPKV